VAPKTDDTSVPTAGNIDEHIRGLEIKLEIKETGAASNSSGKPRRPSGAISVTSLSHSKLSTDFKINFYKG
jgi:hypothetical protein